MAASNPGRISYSHLQTSSNWGKKDNDHWGEANDAESLAELQRQQQELIGKVKATGVNALINEAAQLLVGGKFDEGIAAYEAIRDAYPDEAATSEHQIGVGYFFKKDYEAAIAHYERARDLGADPDMIAGEIAEAKDMLSS